MTKELATTGTSFNNMEEKIRWCELMSQGNLAPKQYQGNPANVLFALEYADAIGISPIYALTAVSVINGKPSPMAELMATLTRQAGHTLRVNVDDKNMVATCTIIRKDDPDNPFTVTWDKAKAETAGLWGNKGPWTQYPDVMLMSRAISACVRRACSEVLAGGIYTPDEAAEDNTVRLKATAHTAPVPAVETPKIATAEIEAPATNADEVSIKLTEVLAKVTGAKTYEDLQSIMTTEAQELNEQEFNEVDEAAKLKLGEIRQEENN